MAIADIQPGVCGLATKVQAVFDEDSGTVTLTVESACESIRRLAAELPEVDGYRTAMAAAPQNPVYLTAAQAHLHAACPVPCAILKAVEVACGLALPRDVTIKLTR